MKLIVLLHSINGGPGTERINSLPKVTKQCVALPALELKSPAFKLGMIIEQKI